MYSSGQIAAFITNPHKPIGGIVSSDEKKTTIASAGRRQEYDTSMICLYTKKSDGKNNIVEIITTIKQSELDELLKDKAILDALRNTGVDNWEGYDIAMKEIE